MAKHSRINQVVPPVPPAASYQPVPAAPQAAYARDAGAYHAAAKKGQRGKRIAIVAVAVALSVLLGGGTAFALYMGYINDQLTRGDKTDEELLGIDEALAYGTSLDEPFYMLLIGSDKREGEEGAGARSDTNIVVRVDPIEDIVTMVSIPRDTKVEIEGHGTQKFNAAYAFGGAASTIEAAEDLLDIEISHYAEVNFLEMAGLVDAVGGVTVENESRIDNHKCDDGDGNHYIIEEGEQHLNGGEALTFARNRDYPDGDFTRQKHQRAVIEAIIDEVLDMPVTSMPGVIEAAAKCVTTDLDVFDVIGLAQEFADAGDLTMYSGMLPSYTQNINGISFVINDEEKTAEMMELVEEGKDPSGIKSDKTAADITSSTIDTSNVIIWEDDDEYGSAGASGGSASKGGTAAGNGSAASSAPASSSSAGASAGNGGAGASSGAQPPAQPDAGAADAPTDEPAAASEAA